MLIDAMRFQVVGTADGTWHWRLLSEGGMPVAQSVRKNASEAQCLYEIALVMSCANSAIERIDPETPRPVDPLHGRAGTRTL